MFKHILHKIVSLTMKHDYEYFTNNMSRSADVQKKILLNLITKNQNSQFGKDYSFKSVKNISDFKKVVPILSYDKIFSRIKKLIKPEIFELCEEKTILLEPTSGSSGANKYIPYTHTLYREFNRAINVWIYDLYKKISGIRKGRHYWSVSPSGSIRTPFRTSISVGFFDDADYLGPAGKIIRKLFVIPSIIKKIRDSENFRYCAALYLLAARDMTLVSVWNPSYFSILMDSCLKYLPSIIRDLYNKTLSLPKADKEIPVVMDLLVLKDLSRSRQLEAIYKKYQLHQNKSRFFQDVWPFLSFISAWGDGNSQNAFLELRSKFPFVEIQPKGLLSTEGIVSFPLIGVPWSVPAFTSHFLEFIPCHFNPGKIETRLIKGESCNDSLGIWELKENEVYSVLLTTGGGLYRYVTGDIIKVNGFYKGLPLIQFLGRENTIDMVGEKLSEYFVKNVFDKVFQKYEIQPGLAFLSPRINHNNIKTFTPGYTLFLDAGKLDIDNARRIGENIEAQFRGNFYYQNAIYNKQLCSLNIFLISENGPGCYQQRLVKEGSNPGDIKSPVFDKRENWDQYFKGMYCSINSSK